MLFSCPEQKKYVTKYPKHIYTYKRSNLTEQALITHGRAAAAATTTTTTSTLISASVCTFAPIASFGTSASFWTSIPSKRTSTPVLASIPSLIPSNRTSAPISSAMASTPAMTSVFSNWASAAFALPFRSNFNLKKKMFSN